MKFISRYKYYIIVICLVISVVSIIISGFLIFKTLSNNRGSTNQQEISLGNNSSNETLTFEESVSNIIKNNPKFRKVDVKNELLKETTIILDDMYASLSIVNSDGFKNDIEVQERVYLYKHQSGAFIQRGSFTYENHQLHTSLMRLGTGGFSYRLITALINGNKGYYLAIEIPNLLEDLTEEQKLLALEFRLVPEQKDMIQFLLALAEQPIQMEDFKRIELDMDQVDKFRNTSIQFGGGNFPSTF